MNKKCSMCNKSQPLGNFYKNRSRKDGHSVYCKGCKKIKRREDYIKHKDKILAHDKEYANNNRNKINMRSRKYYENNRDRILRLRAQNHKKRASDIQYRLKRALRARLYAALKNNYKSGSAVELLGCSIEQFVKYLESKFSKDMSWENYGKWHIDHVLPLSGFDLTDGEQLKLVCHYTNLQPLWMVDNISKSNKTGE